MNGKEVRNKSNLRINLFHEIDIQTEIIENDPASDDIGREKTSKAYTFLEINNGILLQQTVYIKEYYGADAGHVDIYHVEYSIKPAKTLKLSSSQFDNFPQYPILPNEPKKADYKLSIIETINMFPTVKLGIGIIFALSVTCLLIYIVSVQRKNSKMMSDYSLSLKEYESARNSFIQNLSGKTIRELANVPDSVLFTSDDLPYTINDDKKYGDFTLYITQSGYRYHRERTCSKTAYPIHMYKVSQRYSPCSICAKGFKIQKPTWYTDYLDLKARCKHFEISE